jgi:hypothetical protein
MPGNGLYRTGSHKRLQKIGSGVVNSAYKKLKLFLK